MADKFGDVDYYNLERSEIVDVVPPSARRVLDIGCGAGGLGRALKRSRDIEVRGIEIVPEVGEQAKTVLDDVMIGSFSDQVPASWPAPECIVFADVLEHMVDPWDAVRRARAMLAPGGVLVVSIPNISHASILRGLKRGRFDYADYGILDRTHLRFFTRATAVDLVEQGGFEIEFVRHRFDGSVVAQVFDRLLHFDVRPKRRLPSALGRAVDARTIQFIIRAR